MTVTVWISQGGAGGIYRDAHWWIIDGVHPGLESDTMAWMGWGGGVSTPPQFSLLAHATGPKPSWLAQGDSASQPRRSQEKGDRMEARKQRNSKLLTSGRIRCLHPLRDARKSRGRKKKKIIIINNSFQFILQWFRTQCGWLLDKGCETSEI